MATQADPASHEPPPPDSSKLSSFLKRILGKNSNPRSPSPDQSSQGPEPSQEEPSSGGLLRRASRKVVPGLPRAKTFKRQQSEVREKLEPIQPTQAERRAVSVDRRGQPSLRNVPHHAHQLLRASAPDFLDDTCSTAIPGVTLSAPQSPVHERPFLNISDLSPVNTNTGHELSQASYVAKLPSREPSTADAHSVTTSLYDAQIHDELESKWILNLSMHFRDKSKREKFFVTYRETEFLWRRVTISLDYRDAPEDSLELDLVETKFQREKSAKIYEAIRESLQDIQFYDTVTNLKLQTTDGRLHVHVVEDVNEIIHFPTVRMVQHLGCQRIAEKHIEFDSHMSGFVYKVKVGGRLLIKKEIPGPDTVDEFLYEVNALNALTFSSNVIPFHGVVVDNEDQKVKGLLIDFAARGALIDIIYDSQEHGLELAWATRETWARQIVQGLSDVHESGFVQGDFTLSNIVIDDKEDAKIIDINRRGCPVGWEPPEATPLIDSNQRISMYIGVKSDLYQLGMVLWALATLEDEPEAHPRPLRLDSDIGVPRWYRKIVENCLSENPRNRLSATALLAKFPEAERGERYDDQRVPSISVDDGHSLQQYVVDGYERSGQPIIRTVTPQSDLYYSGMGYGSGVASPGLSDDAYYYPPRGRSPPSPLPSNLDECDTPYLERNVTWSEAHTGMSSTEPDDARTDTPTGLEPATTEYMAKKLELPTTTTEPVPEYEPAASCISMLVEERPSVHDAPTSASQAPDTVIEEAKPTQNHTVLESLPLSVDPTPFAQTSEPQWAPKAEPASGSQDSKPTEGLTTSAEAAEDKLDNKPALPPPLVLHQQGDESPSESNYAYTNQPAPQPSDDAYSPPPREREKELAGIGMAYDTQDDIRQPTCSDQDLGLTSTASQNVSTKA